MTSWPERPFEEANLLNPPFCCLGVTAAVIGYGDERGQGMPLPLVYMVLPIVLHRSTREQLPGNRRTSLPAWIQDNPSVRVLFYERLISLKLHTREAILFGSSRGWLSTGEDGSVLTRKRESSLRRAVQQREDEMKNCITKALFVGRWFAAAGSAATVMTLWGIRP